MSRDKASNQPRAQDLPPPSPPQKTLTGERDRFANMPALEVDLVFEEQRPASDRPWAMLEVWTQNRVYAIDVAMRCIEVVEIATQKPVDNHGLIGARLLGGRLVDGENTFLSHPFPRPGTEAVFEQERPSDTSIFSSSSTVTRVVLRLQQLTIGTAKEEDSWGEIVSASRRSKPASAESEREEAK